MHPYTDAVRTTSEDLLLKFTNQLSCKSGVPVSFPATRNPGGVYSDAAEGVLYGASGDEVIIPTYGYHALAVPICVSEKL